MKSIYSDNKWLSDISDDFLNARPALAADGAIGMWWFDEVSAGTATYTSVAGRAGVVRIAIATAAANVTNWVGCAGVQITEPSLNPACEAIIKGDANTDHRIIFGFHQIPANTAISADTDQSANEIFFRKKASATTWECVTRSASGTENIVQLPTVTTNEFRTLKIEVKNSIGTVFFSADNVLVATVTTAIPLSSTRLTIAVGHGVTSTTARSIDLDYLSLLT